MKTYVVKIEDMTNMFYGVAFLDNKVVFVKDALEAEVLKIKISQRKKRFSLAEIVEVIQASPYRNRLASFDHASLLHIDYQHQLDLKEKFLKEEMTDFVQNQTIYQPILGMKNPNHYRNKATIFYRLQANSIKAGIFKRKSKEFQAMDRFYIYEKELEEIALHLEEVFNQYQISVYNDLTDQGLVKHLILRKGIKSGELLLIFVVQRPGLLPPKMLEQLAAEIPNLVGILENIQDQAQGPNFGSLDHLLWGRDYYYDQLFSYRIKISAHAFFQVNHQQMEKLYQLVLNQVPFGLKRIVDAYSGLGTMSLLLSERSETIDSVEIFKDSVLAAEENARLNGIRNINFYHMDVFDYFKQVQGSLDLFIIDPPRKGLSKDVVRLLLEHDIQQIIYISCNPLSLKRDLKDLNQLYRLEYLQAVDMFPHTPHVETVVVLKRR